MTSDQIASHIVDLFNALDDPPIAFQAIKPADVAEVDSERSDFGVFVVAQDEREEPINQDGTISRRTRVVSVAANGPISNLTLSNYLEQMEALRLSLEGTEFEHYRWTGNETISLWDADVLRSRNRFMALFETTYEDFS